MLSTFDAILPRPRCRTWIPLATQQLRLRHLIRVIAYNIKIEDGSLYYTLHFTTMSAPFYTSEKLESQNPKWMELDLNDLQFSSATGVVLRIWQHGKENATDKIVLAWGICLPGLVYLGTKLADVQPNSFKENSVIFQLNGGYFTSQMCVRTDLAKPLPFLDNLNIVKDGENSQIFRNASVKCAKNDIRISYNVKKLQRLHSLQQSIKNKTLDAQELREKISTKCGLIEDTNSDILEVKHTSVETSNPRLLSMSSLNKLLYNKQEQPTRHQIQEIAKMRKLIESARFRTKLLSQEQDRKLANIRRLKEECNILLDNNEDKNSELMSLYRQLSRDIERLRANRRSQTDIRELFLHTNAQLHLRRKQLINQLLYIYPIKKINDNKYSISGVHLPDSESLKTVPENCLSVALGFVTHVVVMCSVFLQVPLRYPLVHLGSRSKISDHITVNIPDRDREFPLYTKDKEHLHFLYAVYLLNKNIAQLRWICGLPTHDLRATLPNLLSLLEGNGDYRFDRTDSILNSRFASIDNFDNQLNKKYGSFSTLEPTSDSLHDKLANNPISSSCEQIFRSESTPIKKYPRANVSDSGPGLSQILTAPKNWNKPELNQPDNVETSPKDCVDCNIEQGLDLLCSAPNEHSISDHNVNGTEPLDLALKLKKRISRSVGSYTDDEKSSLNRLEVGSDPLLVDSKDNLSDQSLPNSLGETRKEFLQHWFNSSPALVCSEDNLCPEEFLGCSSQTVDDVDDDKELTLRVEALESNSTFHLVKPKH